MTETLKKAKPENLGRGTQVVYVPSHIAKNYLDENGELKIEVLHEIRYPNGAQCGFVMRFDLQSQGHAWVRYWYPDGSLRTRANSEMTYLRDLWLHESVKPGVVMGAMDVIEAFLK